jgi:hypothetical protein
VTTIRKSISRAPPTKGSTPLTLALPPVELRFRPTARLLAADAELPSAAACSSD